MIFRPKLIPMYPKLHSHDLGFGQHSLIDWPELRPVNPDMAMPKETANDESEGVLADRLLLACAGSIYQVI